LRGALLGSVSSQVLSHARCSVMLFREHEPSAPAAHARSVVVGIDGSPSSMYALELAQAFAIALAAQLVLVHAYRPHIPVAVMITGGTDELLRNHGHDLLDAARQAVTASVDIQQELVKGNARDALIAVCERHAPALLVVGDRGLGGFRELLLGSTSRDVANHAPCPVLVARNHAPRQ
jgi:nucleotide-binding universal stress UspA family protein